MHLFSEYLDSYWFSSWLENYWPSGRQKYSEVGAKQGYPPGKSFSDFFVHVLRYQLKTWYVHLVGSTTQRVRVSSQSAQYALLYSQNGSKSFFFIYGFNNYIEPSDVVHTLILHLTSFMVGQLLAIWWPQTLGRISQQSSLPVESFLSFLLHVLRYELEIGYIYPVGGRTHQVQVSTQWGIFDPLCNEK